MHIHVNMVTCIGFRRTSVAVSSMRILNRRLSIKGELPRKEELSPYSSATPMYALPLHQNGWNEANAHYKCNSYTCASWKPNMSEHRWKPKNLSVKAISKIFRGLCMDHIPEGANKPPGLTDEGNEHTNTGCFLTVAIDSVCD